MKKTMIDRERGQAEVNQTPPVVVRNRIPLTDTSIETTRFFAYGTPFFYEPIGTAHSRTTPLVFLKMRHESMQFVCATIMQNNQ